MCHVFALPDLEERRLAQNQIVFCGSGGTEMVCGGDGWPGVDGDGDVAIAEVSFLAGVVVAAGPVVGFLVLLGDLVADALSRLRQAVFDAVLLRLLQ
jgi:hypothetical protein